MLEILKKHENVEFGLRRWPPTVPDPKSTRILLEPKSGKKYVFCMAGASKGPFGTEKK